jgi:hypothetical protein
MLRVSKFQNEDIGYHVLLLEATGKNSLPTSFRVLAEFSFMWLKD